MRLIAVLLAVLAMSGCATSEYRAYEGKAKVYDGTGGTKDVVDGMEVWDSGSPPRKFVVIGVVSDERGGGPIPMAMLKSDIVKKARAAGGDAAIKVNSASEVVGFHSTGSANSYSFGGTATTYGSSMAIPLKKNHSKYVVIQFVE